MEAMVYMEKGSPYSLHPDDRKRRLLQEIKDLCQELDIHPVVIGGLAVSHHGYLRTTQDVDLLLTDEDGSTLYKHLKSALGWKRYGEGFKNTRLEIGLDLCLEGRSTSPRWKEQFPNPADLRTVKVDPVPVASLAEVLALKCMSGRAKDDADVVELLKIHRGKIKPLAEAARGRLKTREARAHLAGLVKRTKEEISHRS